MAARVAPMGKLSYDEFKVEMRSSLRDRGVVESLKSQVRASLVQTAGLNLAQAVTIAVRYSVVRRQVAATPDLSPIGFL